MYIVGNGSTYLTGNNFLIAVPKSMSPRATWRKEAIQMSALHNGVSNTHVRGKSFDDDSLRVITSSNLTNFFAPIEEIRFAKSSENRFIKFIKYGR